MRGTVLVTGGTRRIGRAICETLASRGWRVLAHSRDPGNPLSADFAERDGADRLFAAATGSAPDLRAVVNNASVFSTAAELPEAEAERMMRVNRDAPARLAELLAEHLAKRGSTGAAVNLLDARILSGRASTPYAASKLSLARATLEQARRLAPALRVNGVAPGPVLAPEEESNREKGGPTLLPRRPSPADVAAAVAFMLETESVTGQILAVDSGQSCLHSRFPVFPEKPDGSRAVPETPVHGGAQTGIMAPAKTR